MARTITSLDRILDILPALAGDFRLEVWFTVDAGSRFSHGVAQPIGGLEARTVTWEEATATRFHLIIAASDNGDLHRLRGPLLLVPHGAGHQKYSPHTDPIVGTRVVSGFAPSALWHNGIPVPTRIGLSHENQRAQLRQAAPDLVDRAVVIGDPCLSRLTALKRDRNGLRLRLGVEPSHSLVVVTSTWGTHSTIGAWPSLPTDLLAELPYDEFRIAAILHPNVWVQHSSWQVRHWLARAKNAGLILVDPTGPWKSVLAAADCVIGDHGSLSAYSTALRHPLALAAFGDSEVPPNTAMFELGQRITRLVRDLPLAPQIRDIIGKPDIPLLDRLAARVFERDEATRHRLRAVLYELLNLHPPSWSPREPIPEQLDPPSITVPRSFRVAAEFDRRTGQPSVLTLRRYPAILDNPAEHEDGNHLIVASNEPDERLAQNAAIVVADIPMSVDAAAAWGTETLSELPGCSIAAAANDEGALFARLRDGRAVRVYATDGSPDPHLLASALYCRLRGATDAAHDPILLKINDSQWTLEFRPM